MQRAALDLPINSCTTSQSYTPPIAAADISFPEKASVPIWMWLHVLSLDVAFVFAAWAAIFAVSFRVPLQVGSVLLGAAAVWCIYVMDHLLDARGAGVPATERHQFAYRHRHILIPFVLIIIASGMIGAFELPPAILLGGLIFVAAVAMYFGIVHLAGERLRQYWPKEFVVAAIFAAGCVLPTWSLAKASVFAGVAFLLLFALFVLNCAGLEHSEWTNGASIRLHPGTLWVGRRIRAFSLGLAGLSLTACSVAELRPVAVSVALSSVLLSAFFAERRSSLMGRLRAAADLALLTPLLVLPFVWR
jgi:hypothetical protein